MTTARSRRSSRAPTTTTAVSHALRINHNTVVDEEIAVMPIDLEPITRTNSLLSLATESSVDMIHYPLINTAAAMTVLGLITAIMYLTAENLVDSLTALTDQYPNGISREFLSLIVLPVLSNGAELSTAVYAGYKGKFDLVLGVAVGSCIQITLFVIPLLVCVAWGLGKPLSLLFDPLEISVRVIHSVAFTWY
jgi:Ca2+:H+ antiporter